MKNKTKTNYLLGFLLSTFLIIGIINITNGITIDTNPDISKLHTPSIFSLFLGNSSNSVEMSVATGSNNLDILNGLIVGKNNKVTGSAKLSVIGGGLGNQISASYAGIGGGQNNTINKGENGAIGGGYSNKIGLNNTAKNGVIAGGINNLDDGGGIILGGKGNVIPSGNEGGIILGGTNNRAGTQSLILGSAKNPISRAPKYSFIWNQKEFKQNSGANINAENGMLIGTYNPITGVSLVVSGATKLSGDNNSHNAGGIFVNSTGCIQFYDGNVYNTLGKTSENNDYCGINTGCQFGAYTLHNGDIATGYSVSYTGNCQNASDNVTCTNGKMIDKDGKSDKYIYPYCYDLSPNPVIDVQEGYQLCTGLPENAEWVNQYFKQTKDQNGGYNPPSKTGHFSSDKNEECSYECKTGYEPIDNKCVALQVTCGVNSDDRFFNPNFQPCTNGSLDGDVNTKIEEIDDKYQAKRSWSCKNDYTTILCSALRPTANFYTYDDGSDLTFKVQKDITWNNDAVNFNGVTTYVVGLDDIKQRINENNPDVEMSNGNGHNIGIKFKSTTDSYKVFGIGGTEMSNENGVRYGNICRNRNGVQSNKCENPSSTDNLFWVKDGYVIIGNNKLSDKSYVQNQCSTDIKFPNGLCSQGEASNINIQIQDADNYTKSAYGTWSCGSKNCSGYLPTATFNRTDTGINLEININKNKNGSYTSWNSDNINFNGAQIKLHKNNTEPVSIPILTQNKYTFNNKAGYEIFGISYGNSCRNLDGSRNNNCNSINTNLFGAKDGYIMLPGYLLPGYNGNSEDPCGSDKGRIIPYGDTPTNLCKEGRNGNNLQYNISEIKWYWRCKKGDDQVLCDSAKNTDYTVLTIGSSISTTMTELAGNKNNIKSIKEGTKEKMENIAEINKKEIQDKLANYVPVYMWYDNGTMYYYTDANKIYMNPNSSNMFAYCTNLTDISGLSKWDTSKVEDMSKMFLGCTNLKEVDLSNWNTSKLEYTDFMFADCHELKKIYVSNKFNVDNVTKSNSTSMFRSCTNIEGGQGTAYTGSHVDKEYARLDCGTSAPGYFSSKTSYSCNNNTSEAYLTGGITINRYMGEIANNNLSNIQHFKMYTGNTNNIPSDTDTRTRIISTDDSPYKVKMWYDENSSTIYYYTEADIIYLNPYSSQMFENVLNVQDIDTLKWNTSKVKTMKRMFFRCTKLTNLNVSNWNTSSVEDMSFMFNYCYKLTNLNVSNWVTSSVENMQSMFDDCYGLTNLNVSNWNTSNVKNMSAMFDSCTSLTTLDLSSFITLNVDDMSDMFNNCQNLKNLNISFDTSNVTKLSGMFKNCNSLTSVNVGNWVTSKVDDMNNMFNGCNSLTNIDVSNWDTSNVENMQSMFEGCSSLTNLDVSNWNVNNVHNFYSMFEGCSSLTKLDVSKWKILPNNSQIQPTMEYMFSGGANLICLDISNWGGRIEDARIQGMFSNCENLKTIFARPFWDNGDVFNRYSADNSKNMFLGDINLVGGAGTTYNKNNVNASYARIDVLPNFPGYFTSKNTNDPGCDSIQLMNEAYLISGSDINYYMRELAGKTISNIQHFKMYTGNPDNISSDIEIISTEDSPNEVIMWYDDNDKTIYYYSDADIIYMNPDSSSMFEDLENLTDISGISKLNTSKVTDMSYMFYRCTKLQTLDLSNFDTSNVQNMKGMFSECSNLKYLDLSNFDTHNVINMSEMFNSCSSLTGLDLSNFDTRIVKNMNFMFSNCTNLVKIYASYKFTTDHTDYINQTAQNDYVSSIRMFSGDTSLIGGNGTKFNSSHVDKEYARLDCRDRPGYFSSKNGYSCIFNGRCGSEPYTCESGIPNFNWYGYSDGSDYVAGYDEIITGYKRDCIGIGGGTSEIGCTACPEQYCYYDRGGLYYSSNTGCHYQITNYYNNNKNCSIVWDNGFISSYGANCNWIDSPAMSNECKKRNYDYNGHITQFGGYTEHFNSLYPSRVEYKPLDHFVCGSSALFTNIPTADPSSRWRLINQCTNTVSREYYPYS